MGHAKLYCRSCPGKRYIGKNQLIITVQVTVQYCYLNVLSKTFYILHLFKYITKMINKITTRLKLLRMWWDVTKSQNERRYY